MFEDIELSEFGGVAGAAFITAILVQFVGKPWLRKLHGLKASEDPDNPDDPEKKELYKSSVNLISILIATLIGLLVQFALAGELTFATILLAVFTGIIAGLTATGGAETAANFATRFKYRRNGNG
jgi:hypothetical protein